MTITATGHGFSTGDVVEIAVSGWEGVYTIASVPDANSFTYEDLVHRNVATGTGTAYKLFAVDNATTTGSITATSTGSLQANGSVGLAATSIGGSQPGYEIYVSLYNVTTRAVGNRRQIPGRYSNTETDTSAIFYVQGLTDPSSIDSEFTWLVGRTGDGAEVPYAIADSGVNWQHTDTANFVIREGAIDGNSELPVRNDPPSGLDQVVTVGGRIFGHQSNSPYIFYTPDGGSTTFVGKAWQAWFADSFETFPTAKKVLCIAEYDQELVVWTDEHVAILSEVSGVLGWRGPWPLGIAGPRAFLNTPHGPYWVTGDKRLATITGDGPVIVSEEYEAAELAEIGSSYLSDTELAYSNVPGKRYDHLKIKCRDASGNPFEVRHDFKLRDGRSPYGQGYEAVYVGALASDYTLQNIRDDDGVLQCWAGGSDGQFYQLDDGGDDAGTDFTGDYIGLVNLGEEKKSLSWMTFFGDSRMTVCSSDDLNETAAGLLAKTEVASKIPGGDNDFHFRVNFTRKGVDSPRYLRFRLTSHPSDEADSTNPLAASSIPNLPVEDYGRIYSVKLGLADGRGQ
jgi:hypothetical protein